LSAGRARAASNRVDVVLLGAATSSTIQRAFDELARGSAALFERVEPFREYCLPELRARRVPEREAGWTGFGREYDTLLGAYTLERTRGTSAST